MRAQRNLKLFFLITIIGIISFLGFNITKKAIHKKEAAEKIQTLPDFQFYTLDDQPFKRASLQAGLPVAILLFNTECDHCLYEAAGIQKKMDQFQGIELLFVSGQEAATIKDFKETFGFDKNPNIKVLRDKSEERLKKLGTDLVPSAFIYDRSHQLVKHFTGETSPEAILKTAGIIK